jgi:hypothetical protein
MSATGALRAPRVTAPNLCPITDADDTAVETHREPAWNPWLYACGDRLKEVVSDVIRQARSAEAHLREFQRKRVRRPTDLTTFHAQVEALVAHVSYEYLRGAGPVRLTLDNNVLRRSSRYVSKLQSSQLPNVIALLSTPELSFLTFNKGEKPTAFGAGRQSTISAGPRLVSRLVGVELDDIGRRPGEEVVLLKGAKDTETGVASLIDYDDNEPADQHRAEVQKENAFLAAADVRYVGETPLVDERDRHMKRRFTRGSFGSGGRLWGGFWQNLRKSDRLTNVLINSEPVASVDFASMIVSIAYAYVGAATPAGDLYGITFHNTEGVPVVFHSDPKEHRRVIKKIVAARLNGAKDWPNDLRAFRPGLPWRSVVETLKQAHAPIADVFDRDLGQEFAFTESEILVEALLRLVDLGVVALPIHDCIVVAESDLDAAERAMLESFKFHTNQTGRVSIERSKDYA